MGPCCWFLAASLSARGTGQTPARSSPWSASSKSSRPILPLARSHSASPCSTPLQSSAPAMLRATIAPPSLCRGRLDRRHARQQKKIRLAVADSDSWAVSNMAQTLIEAKGNVELSLPGGSHVLRRLASALHHL